jgi:hypothetical protein
MAGHQILVHNRNKSSIPQQFHQVPGILVVIRRRGSLELNVSGTRSCMPESIDLV